MTGESFSRSCFFRTNSQIDQ